MYDTKKKELRWNATYFDYAATLPDKDIKYSKNFVAVFGGFPHLWAMGTGKKIMFCSTTNRSN